MRSSFRLAFLIVAVGVMSGASAMATMDEIGHGSRAISMGQAQVAASNDYSAIFYNAAALVKGRNDWGLGTLDPLVYVQSAGQRGELYINGVNQEEKYAPNIALGALIPIMKRMVVGVEVFLSTDELLTIELFYGPQIARYRPDYTFGLCVGFGFQVLDNLYVGFTNRSQLAYNASSLNIDIGPIITQILGIDLGIGTKNVNPAFELDVMGRNSYGAGALYEPFKWLSLGVGYNYRNPSPITIPVTVTAGGLISDINLIIEKWDISPSIVTGGVAVKPLKELTLAFDLSYALYSKEKKGGMRLVSDGSVLESEDWENVELEDVYIPKLGVEWKSKMKGRFDRVDYALRAGYMYYPTPYPPAQTEKNVSTVLDNDAHYYTGGFMIGYRPYRGSIIKGPAFVGLEYFYEYIHLVERDHVNIQNNPPVIVSKGNLIYNGMALTMHW